MHGGEFLSAQFGRYLHSEGMQHEVTVPRTPQQNGVAERLNRTLFEKVRSMLINQKVPHAFWVDALTTSVYLKNRSPTSYLDGLTPFEAWKGNKPDVGHLRVYGCDAYICSCAQRRRKLDKSEEVHISWLW